MTSRILRIWRSLVHRNRVEEDLDEEVPSIDELLRDIRYTGRLLWRSPLFTLTAALSLAIGIGGNTTIFTIANGLLLSRPAGVFQPNRVVDIGRTQSGPRGGRFNQSSYPNFIDIRRRTTTIEGVYAYLLVSQPMNLTGAAGVEPVLGNLVTTNYFEVLGVRPAKGRLFNALDSEQPGASPIAVLSYAFWSRHYNADPSVVGKTLQLNGHPLTVVGVAPDKFRGTSVIVTDVWVPATMASALNPTDSSTATNRKLTWLMMGGRLKPGVSLSQAAAELDTIGQTLEREYPENRGSGLRVVPASLIPGNLLPVGPFLAVLMVIVSLVLAIACANVAGVLLARASARRREIAVRLAIGATPGRIVRQLLTETLILFAIGGAAGLVMARLMTSSLLLLLPVLPIPVDLSLALDSTVVAFSMGLSLVAALFSGLIPALQTSKTDVVSSLKGIAQPQAGAFRTRDAFVVAQVAFSITLVVGAGLFVRALQRGSAVDIGFDPHGVELGAVDLSVAGYTEKTGPQFARDMVSRLGSLPEVQNVTLAAAIPMGNLIRLTGRDGGLSVPGVSPPNGERYFETDWNIVEPGYFSTMRVPLVAGRDFQPTDRDGEQAVAIVSQAAARQFWPLHNAVGQYVQLERIGFPGKPDTVKRLFVIGVARDTKYRSLREDARTSLVYVPLQQQYNAQFTLIARTTRGQRIANEIRMLVAQMNPNLTIDTSQTLEDVVAVALVPQRVAAAVSASLGIIGVLLAAIGIYGVTAFAVTRRTREIGIRMALGAQRGTIVSMFLRQGLSLIGIGAAIGVIFAAVGSRLLGTLLFGIQPMDPLTFGGAVVLFVAIGLAACFVPARRASRIDSMAALRAE